MERLFRLSRQLPEPANISDSGHEPYVYEKTIKIDEPPQRIVWGGSIDCMNEIGFYENYFLNVTCTMVPPDIVIT